MRKAALTLALSMTTALAAAGSARADAPPQLSTAFKINHADPAGSVPSIKARNEKPIEFGYYLQDLASFAEAARRSNDRVLEARYYLAFAKAVPDRATGFSKACEALEAANKREEALLSCRAAVGLEGVELKDYVRFVHLLLAKPDALAAAEKDELGRTVAHLQADPQSRIAGLHLQCEVALHVQDYASLETCARALERFAPNDTKTITFLWALASHQGNHRDADILIARARHQGVAPALIARMERTTRQIGWRRYLPSARVAWAGGIVAVAGLAIAAFALFGPFRRRLRRDRHQAVARAQS